MTVNLQKPIKARLSAKHLSITCAPTFFLLMFSSAWLARQLSFHTDRWISASIAHNFPVFPDSQICKAAGSGLTLYKTMFPNLDFSTWRKFKDVTIPYNRWRARGKIKKAIMWLACWYNRSCSIKMVGSWRGNPENTTIVAIKFVK